MPDFISLTCPKCAARLQVTNDIDRFACQFCGTEHLVRRSGGIVSLAPVIEKLDGIEKGISQVLGGVEKTEQQNKKVAAELAIRRLREELQEANRSLSALKESPVPSYVPDPNERRMTTILIIGWLSSVALVPLGIIALVVAYFDSSVLGIVIVAAVVLLGTLYLSFRTVKKRGLARKQVRIQREKRHADINALEAHIRELQGDLELSQRVISGKQSKSFLCLNQFISNKLRDEIIRERYAAGETLSDLARDFGLSPQRVYQVTRNAK